MVVCVQYVVWKETLLVQFGDGHKKDMSSSSIVFLSSKEDIEMDQPLSNYPEK